MNENEKRLWWQAYLAALAGCYACPDQDSLPASASSDAIRAAKMAVGDYREACGPDSPASDSDWTGHARVELMGHRSYLGRIREVERYGARLGEVQELLPSGEYGEVHQFGGKGVYEIHPMTLEAALAEVRPGKGVYCGHCGIRVRTAKWGDPNYEKAADEFCDRCKAEGNDKCRPATCGWCALRPDGVCKLDGEPKPDNRVACDSGEALSASDVCQECGEALSDCECEPIDDEDDDDPRESDGSPDETDTSAVHPEQEA